MLNRTLSQPFIFSLVMALPVLSSCSAQRANSNDLKANQIKWSSAKIASYRYIFQIGCYCPEDTTAPVTFEVRNGVRVSLTRTSGVINHPKEFYHYDTIEKVFRIAEKAIHSNAEEVKIEYDSTLGYPTLISVDGSKSWYDDEMSFSITKFEKIQ